MQNTTWNVDEYWSVSHRQPDQFQRHDTIQQAMAHAGDKGFVCTSPIGQFYQVIESENGQTKPFDMISERDHCDLSADNVYQAARNLQQHYTTLTSRNRKRTAVFHA